jgi:hypothetical protein
MLDCFEKLSSVVTSAPTNRPKRAIEKRLSGFHKGHRLMHSIDIALSKHATVAHDGISEVAPEVSL